jgi:hypothetical protein
VARQIPISAELHDRLYEAFFTETLKADSAARENGDRAFAVVSAVTGALVAAGVAVDIGDRSRWVQVAGMVAIVLWLGAAHAFVRTVSHATFPVGPAAKDDEVNEQWGNQTIEEALTARRVVYNKLRVARWASAAAGTVTILALSLTLADRRSATETLSVSLTRRGNRTVEKLCPGIHEVHGRVTLASLASQYINIELPAGSCGAGSRMLRLQRAEVLGLVSG